MEIGPREIRWLTKYLESQLPVFRTEALSAGSDPCRRLTRKEKWLVRLMQDQVAPALIQCLSQSPNYPKFKRRCFIMQMDSELCNLN